MENGKETPVYGFTERMPLSDDFISTGIDKLDALLDGGIPKGFTTLILSVPGSGCEILFKQMASCGNTLIFSTEETKEEIESTMKRFGWNPEGVEIVDIASSYRESVILSQQERVNIYLKRAGVDLKELIMESSGGFPKTKKIKPHNLSCLRQEFFQFVKLFLTESHKFILHITIHAHHRNPQFGHLNPAMSNITQ